MTSEARQSSFWMRVPHGKTYFIMSQSHSLGGSLVIESISKVKEQLLKFLLQVYKPTACAVIRYHTLCNF